MEFWALVVIFLALAAVPSPAAFPVRPTAARTRQQASILCMTATPTSNEASVKLGTQQQPDIYQTNLEISKLASLAPKNATAAAEAQRLLQDLPHANTITYNTVLNALAKSSSLDGAQKAQDLLEQMEKTYEQQSRANQEWYTGMSNTTENLYQGAPVISVKPNVCSYSTVMDGWSRRSGKVPQAAQRANSILEKLEALYRETNDSTYKPNAISYNTVIAAFAKDKGHADQAIQILKKMGSLADIISYNTVLLALARSGLPDAGERAEALLREMKFVNARSYTTTIDAWSRCHSYSDESAERAYALVQEMEDKYEKTRDVLVRPNCITYSTVINAYALSKDFNKAKKAWNILQRMRELSDSGKNVNAKPSLITYNSVLNACATSMPAMHLQVKQMVYSLYKEIMENPTLQADHFTYGTGE